jgi:hypothetical protein
MMAESTQLERVWNHKNFYIEKTSLESQAEQSAKNLGRGVIYAPELWKGLRGFPRTRGGHAPVGHGRQSEFYLWNPLDIAGAVKADQRELDFFLVGLNYDPRLRRYLGRDNAKVVAATMYLLDPRWPKSFRDAVRADLLAIGGLAQSYVRHAEPSVDDIARAENAKRDLEVKLAWFGKALLQAGSGLKWLGLLMKGGGTGEGGDSGGGGRGVGKSPWEGDLPDPKVRVIVTTKGADGITEVKGWRVFANRYVYKGDWAKANKFAKLSDPKTERFLDVGSWTMWAEQVRFGEKAVVGERVVIDVQPPPKLEVDLVVPQA